MNKIEFLPSSEDVHLYVEPPTPGKNCIPAWFKDIKPFKESQKMEFDEKGSMINKNLKMCLPFVDAISCGFIQKTWCDIYIDKSDNSMKYYWAHSPAPLGDRATTNITISEKYYPLEFHWKNPWIPRTPKGWSVLITHPNNRLDLPFTTLSGIIDSDNFYHVEFGQYPFYVDANFEGLIPVGTPMFQIIPFKRDDWKMYLTDYQSLENKKRSYHSLREFWGVYKNYFWKKKKYE